MLSNLGSMIMGAAIICVIALLFIGFGIFVVIELLGSVAIIFGKKIIDNDIRKFWTADWFYPVGYVDWICALFFRGRLSEDYNLIISGRNRSISFIIRYFSGIVGFVGLILLIVTIIISLILPFFAP